MSSDKKTKGKKKSIDTQGATKKIVKKAVPKVKKPVDPSKPPRVKVDYHVLLPKSGVRAVTLKNFKGAVGSAPTVGLAAVTERFMLWLHERASARGLAAYLKKVAAMRITGKFTGKGTHIHTRTLYTTYT